VYVFYHSSLDATDHSSVTKINLFFKVCNRIQFVPVIGSALQNKLKIQNRLDMGGAELLIPIMGIIWPMLALIIFVYMYFTTRTKIKMALIESGRDASIFRRSGKTVNRLRTLKQGVIFLMAGLGLLFGSLLEAMTNMPEPVAYFAPILLLIGMGLIVFYVYLGKQPLEDTNDGLMETL